MALKKNDAPRGPKRFVIARDRWGRGNPYHTGLCTEDDKQCCLGFFLEAAGVARRTLRVKQMPGDVVGRPRAKVPGWLRGRYWNAPDLFDSSLGMSQDCHRLASLNDSDQINDATREKRVAAIFAKHGVAVRFVDTVPPRRRRRAS